MKKFSIIFGFNQRQVTQGDLLELRWHIGISKKKNNKNNTSDMMSGSYLGPQYNNEEIENDLKKVGAKFEKYSDEEILIKTSKLLNEGNAIGWFQGKMEYGPRAL